ncbi:MAG: trigger factor [bacterium]|nr:MAG: trigger factor [bacterium]
MERKIDEHEINTTVTEESGCRRVITVEIARERFTDEQERVLAGMLKKVALPGFRKGKVPPEIVRRRFSEEIQGEALKAILPLAYGHVVSTEKLEPIGDPVFSDVSTEAGELLTFTIEVEVMPAIEIDNYRDMKVPLEKIEVNDEEIDQVLGNLQDRNAEFEPVDRPAVTSDLVVIDYTPVRQDGTVDEKQRVEDFPVELGSGQLFPAFEQAIAGKAKGGTARVEIGYPDDFKPEHLAGKKNTYEFTIKDIREKRVPPLDDAFAQKMGPNLKSINDLREDVKKRLEGEKLREAQRKREEAAIDRLIERHPFEVPRSMYERFKQELHEEDRRRREAMGMEPEKDEEKRKKLDEFLGQVAQRNIKRYFIIDHIATKEGFEIPDDEIEAETVRIATESNRPLEEVKKYFQRGTENFSNLKGRLRERKVFAVMLGSA